jgi:mannose-6-phosphate isomerase class I
MTSLYRKSSQPLMPAVKPVGIKGKYDIYPVFSIGNDKIFRGIESLAERIAGEQMVTLDGFSGVFFDQLRTSLDSIFRNTYKIHAKWINTASFLKSEKEINKMISPFLGEDDPLFGTSTDLDLNDFFDPGKLRLFLSEPNDKHYIIYGIGASLFSDEGLLIYFDLPKNELQYRSRAGSVANLGAHAPADPKIMYKRYYFVDWVVLARHKQNIIEHIDILVDAQRSDDITWTNGCDFRRSLSDMTRNAVRVRPWFEPGIWGGSWIKDNLPGLNTKVPNYAWSFELITPENGLIVESSGLLLEFSFDFLMFHEAERVLGDSYKRFGTDFPIRFDYLDTFDGGNLSIQCHPVTAYMKENFGEDFTQEETYYLVDTKENASVFLGFQDSIDSEEFKNILEVSSLEAKPVEIEKYVQKHQSHKHDLFLVPPGTIHGSGKNNMVLEISSTPYIFTFKMYDWLRPDLDGKPRSLNIGRGFKNLHFERKGISVQNTLISVPVLIEEGMNWELFHLPTHPTQLYDVKRYHFTETINVLTNNKFHVLNLVEGKDIMVEISGGRKAGFSFAETFIIPASVKEYKVVNLSQEPAILIIAFVK